MLEGSPPNITLGNYAQRSGGAPSVDRYGTGSAVTNSWNWDAPNGTGELESRSTNGFTETYGYRALDGKLSSIVTNVNVAGVYSNNFTRTFGYDSFGRLDSIGYPNATFTYVYDAVGYRTQVKSGSTVLANNNTQDNDAFGNETVTSFANGLTTVRGYDAGTGRLTSIQTGTASIPTSIQDLEYKWRSNSTLYQRTDYRQAATLGDLIDTFSYDLKERLMSQVSSGYPNRTLTFGNQTYGNLTSKTSSVAGDLNVTGYTYGVAAKPHRLTSVVIAGITNTLSYDGDGNITTYDAASGTIRSSVMTGRTTSPRSPSGPVPAPVRQPRAMRSGMTRTGNVSCAASPGTSPAYRSNRWSRIWATMRKSSRPLGDPTT